MKKLKVDNQAVSSGKSVPDSILDKPGTGVPCDHKQQHVELVKGKHYQICCNKRCERQLFVR
jgi:methyl coenzyme M reductase subunit D